MTCTSPYRPAPSKTIKKLKQPYKRGSKERKQFYNSMYAEMNKK